jgi:hypothetical protein
MRSAAKSTTQDEVKVASRCSSWSVEQRGVTKMNTDEDEHMGTAAV